MKNTIAIILLCFLFASCKDMWPEEDKQALRQAFMESAAKWTNNDTAAKAYCDCVIKKIIDKYPFENEALDNMDKLMKDTSLIKCRDEVIVKYKLNELKY